MISSAPGRATRGLNGSSRRSRRNALASTRRRRNEIISACRAVAAGKAAHPMIHRPAIRSDAGIAARALLTAIAVATSPCAAQPSDKTDGRGVYLRFLSKREASGNLQKPPLLGMSFGGKQRHAVMDT